MDACVRVLLVATVAVALRASADADAGAIFAKKCSSCHTFGKGDLIGPDLKGVGDRHARPWLRAWIRSSESVLRSGDADALALFKRYRQQRMPDHDLSSEQIDALLDYLARCGPEADAAAQWRDASTATKHEVALGRELFYGQVRLANGGAACASCHGLSTRALAGTLGPDLSGAYSKYADRGMSSLLRRSCFPRVPSLEGKHVTDDESFALKAFLRQADARSRAK